MIMRNKQKTGFTLWPGLSFLIRPFVVKINSSIRFFTVLSNSLFFCLFYFDYFNQHCNIQTGFKR